MDMDLVNLALSGRNDTVIWHWGLSTEDVQHQGNTLMAEHVISTGGSTPAIFNDEDNFTCWREFQF